MTHALGGVRRLTIVLLGMVLWSAAVTAQTPTEVGGVGFEAPELLTWEPVPGADSYNVYRGTLGELTLGVAGRCHGFHIETSAFVTTDAPATGSGYFYVIAAGSEATGEGPIGQAGAPRTTLGECNQTMRAHVLDRIGYGRNEWSDQRIESLGIDEYIAEQLDPTSIDESDNEALTRALFGLAPPENFTELFREQIVRAVYSRRQLERNAAEFWANHFNTHWMKVGEAFKQYFPKCTAPGVPAACDPNWPAAAVHQAATARYGEIEAFREIAFHGTFREMLEASALSPAMILFLDTSASVAGNPNENYPRELMELHSMGVDGGYTQQDVEELSRVITGWTTCKKTTEHLDDPLAPCIDAYWEELPAGSWVAHFVPAQHDCSSKALFAGTTHELFIAESCGDAEAGVQELRAALDAIVAHPATARFISRKLLERFVTDAPNESMVDELVETWVDPSNPHGIGDLRAVLSAALDSSLMNPDLARTKVKTPQEQLVSMLRAVRGRTDGLTGVYPFLESAGHVPNSNPSPTGWAEDGAAWIATNDYVVRQSLAIDLLNSHNGRFFADPIGLLHDAGISTEPGHAEAIVDFFIDALFGGALTPIERLVAIEHLTTDDVGNPTEYDDMRIRDTVALLLGYPQFQEQ